VVTRNVQITHVVEWIPLGWYCSRVRWSCFNLLPLTSSASSIKFFKCFISIEISLQSHGAVLKMKWGNTHSLILHWYLLLLLLTGHRVTEGQEEQWLFQYTNAQVEVGYQNPTRASSQTSCLLAPFPFSQILPFVSRSLLRLRKHFRWVSDTTQHTAAEYSGVIGPPG
jgi:hypothetical protein